MDSPRDKKQELNPEAGERVTDLRGKRTQVEMAALAGVTQGQWSKLENGLIPKVQVLQKIAQALDTTIEYICFGIEKRNFKQYVDAVRDTTEDSPFGLSSEDQEAYLVWKSLSQEQKREATRLLQKLKAT